jgi:hypothetical protein
MRNMADLVERHLKRSSLPVEQIGAIKDRKEETFACVKWTWYKSLARNVVGTVSAS